MGLSAGAYDQPFLGMMEHLVKDLYFLIEVSC